MPNVPHSNALSIVAIQTAARGYELNPHHGSCILPHRTLEQLHRHGRLLAVDSATKKFEFSFSATHSQLQ